jgi:hypothetical protein
MKIIEFTNSLKTYLATVRVVLRDATMTARTTITTNSLQQARAMLTRIYGDGNVLSISESVNASARTCQINAQASFPDQRRHRQQLPKRNAPAEFSCVAETESATRVLSPSELQVKSLSDRAKQINQQAKQLKARQSLANAQKNLRQAGADPA